MNHKISIRPVTPTIGAEIYGVDLNGLNQMEFARISQAWLDHNTMHYAVNDYDGKRRLMFRTTIKGHAPIAA